MEIQFVKVHGHYEPGRANSIITLNREWVTRR